MERHCRVQDLTESQRRTLEEVMGEKLGSGQEIVIRITESHFKPSAATEVGEHPHLAAWRQVLDGLTPEQVRQVEQIALTRANLTRPTT